ncbi:MAG TPA: PepSY-like domain-containing protein [Chitinophagaceae bacterium]|nr:PepSY-like domain-containing protein [Chitinophagaceae bacterium]
MKKISLLVLAVMLFSGALFAQLRSIPAAVTDAFSSRYPHADNVSWKDKLTYFEASFKLNNIDMKADFSSKGAWKSSEAQMSYEALPAAVKDGFAKSKYADWTKGSVAEIQHMGKAVQYRVYAEKSQPFQKRFLYFNADGRLIKDALTL